MTYFKTIFITLIAGLALSITSFNCSDGNNGSGGGDSDIDIDADTDSDSDTESPEVCGDGYANVFEECDGDSLNGYTCADLGFSEGILACTDDCLFDTSGCGDPSASICGNNIRESNELCDDGDTVACDGMCSPDCEKFEHPDSWCPSLENPEGMESYDDPLAPPIKIWVRQSDPKTVELHWLPSPSDNIKSYEINRNNIAIVVVDADVFKYTDSSVSSGETHRYRVTANNSSNQQSKPSLEVAILVNEFSGRRAPPFEGVEDPKMEDPPTTTTQVVLPKNVGQPYWWRDPGPNYIVPNSDDSLMLCWNDDDTKVHLAKIGNDLATLEYDVIVPDANECNGLAINDIEHVAVYVRRFLSEGSRGDVVVLRSPNSPPESNGVLNSPPVIECASDGTSHSSSISDDGKVIRRCIGQTNSGFEGRMVFGKNPVGLSSTDGGSTAYKGGVFLVFSKINDGGHDAANSWLVADTDDLNYLYSQSGVGSSNAPGGNGCGHSLEERAAYNPSIGMFSRVCRAEAYSGGSLRVSRGGGHSTIWAIPFEYGQDSPNDTGGLVPFEDGFAMSMTSHIDDQMRGSRWSERSNRNPYMENPPHCWYFRDNSAPSEFIFMRMPPCFDYNQPVGCQYYYGFNAAPIFLTKTPEPEIVPHIQRIGSDSKGLFLVAWDTVFATSTKHYVAIIDGNGNFVRWPQSIPERFPVHDEFAWMNSGDVVWAYVNTDVANNQLTIVRWEKP